MASERHLAPVMHQDDEEAVQAQIDAMLDACAEAIRRVNGELQALVDRLPSVTAPSATESPAVLLSDLRRCCLQLHALSRDLSEEMTTLLGRRGPLDH